jgi:hypothetical protein
MNVEANTDPRQRKAKTGDFALVQVAEFRCMAVLRRDGKWHAAYHRNETLKVLEVVEVLSAA